MQTTTDWRTMPAGRELDAIVAVRVMGFWRTDDTPRGPQWWGPHPSLPGERAYASVCVPGDLWGPNVDQRDGLPKFSTDIAAAWQLVGALNQAAWCCKLRNVVGGWSATFRKPSNPSGHFTSSGDTAPLAICRAALAAVEGA